MPAFLKHKLQEQYGKNSAVPYKVMNSIGAMHGNKTTAKGKEMEAKHRADLVKKNGRKHRSIGAMMMAG